MLCMWCIEQTPCKTPHGSVHFSRSVTYQQLTAYFLCKKALCRVPGALMITDEYVHSRLCFPSRCPQRIRCMHWRRATSRSRTT